MKEYEYHPVANIFPLMEGKEFAELVEDVKKNGVRTPITLSADEKIIDGRNRYRAAKEAGVECPSMKWSGEDAVSFAISANIHRRQLTPSQAAMCAERARGIIDEMAKERQKRKPAKSVMEKNPEQNGTARDQAGKLFGVNGRYVDRARRVRTNGIPELAAAVESGAIGLVAAERISSAPKEMQKAILDRPRRPVVHISADRNPSKVPHRTLIRLIDKAIEESKKSGLHMSPGELRVLLKQIRDEAIRLFSLKKG